MDSYDLFLEKANKLHSNYTFKKETFIIQQLPMTATCSLHGDFEITPRNILRSTQTICKDCLKSERFEDFIEKANKVHNNKYNYSSVNYINNRTKVRIICPEHGEFEQQVRGHLNGDGCPECGKQGRIKALLDVKKVPLEELLNRIPETHKHVEIDMSTYTTQDDRNLKIVCPEHGDQLVPFRGFLKNCHGCAECTEDLNGWSKTNFVKRAKRNGNAIFYIIKCFNENEEFYKFGITTTSIKRRYASKKFPYSYEIIQEIHDKAGNIWDLERLLLKIYKKYSYTPHISFSGSTECFQLP